MNVDLYVNEKGSLQIRIDDMNGRMIKQIQSDIVEGMNTIIIDVKELSKGMYTIRLDDHHTLNQILKFSKL